MIAWAEAAAGIYGAFLLARRNRKGLDWLDATPRGFWRSFWAALVVAPAFVVLQTVTGGFGEDPGLRQVLVQAIAYVIGWTAFPLVMILVADTLGRWPAYYRYMVAYNWSEVVQMGVLLPAVGLAILLPSPVTFLLAQVVTILLLVYRGYIAHVALGVKAGHAVGIVLLDVLLSQLVRMVGDRLMGA